MEKKKKKLVNQKKRPLKSSKRNKEFAVVAYFFLFIFIAMIGYIVYFNSFKSEAVINSPYNSRQDSFADSIIRGDILDSKGNVLATTQVGNDGSENRYYPYGNIFAQVVGYSTKGKTGIEALANFSLLRSHTFFVDRIFNQIKNEKNYGDSVVTTLDAELQKVAYNALGSSKGAVMAIEPATGKILAMVSKPSYNPNNLDAIWESITSSNNSDSVLINRCTQGLYPPGSVFKIFTTLEYIKENPGTYNSYYHNCVGKITENDYTLRCYDGRAHGEIDLETSFAKSCNTSFANIGLSLDNNGLKNLCESLLFNKALPFDMEYNKSSFTLDSSSTKEETMMTAIGQGETLVTPLHMSLITSAIANNGVLMKPYLIQEIQNKAGNTVSKTYPKEYGRLISENDALILKDYMQSVVTNGTGYKFYGVNYYVAGKTGSAEYSSDKSKSHSWFVGYSPVENPQIAICVVVEGGGAGSETAVPIARTVLDAYYK